MKLWEHQSTLELCGNFVLWDLVVGETVTVRTFWILAFLEKVWKDSPFFNWIVATLNRVRGHYHLVGKIRYELFIMTIHAFYPDRYISFHFIWVVFYCQVWGGAWIVHWGIFLFKIIVFLALSFYVNPPIAYLISPSALL